MISSEKQGLLSIGKMIYSEYRFAKHFLFNESACYKLMNGGGDIVAYFTAEIEKLSGSFRRRRREENSFAIIGEMMNLLGEFVDSETPPAGQQPLTYDLYKMSLIGETFLEAVPKMVTTIKLEIDPVLEVFRVDNQSMNLRKYEF